MGSPPNAVGIGPVEQLSFIVLLDRNGIKPVEAKAGGIPSPRTLKIEEQWISRRLGVKSKIRIIGKWLEQAGFKPGQRMRLTVMASGVMELRAYDPAALPQTDGT